MSTTAVPWSPQRILDAVHVFVQGHAAWPGRGAWVGGNHLPRPDVIRAHFGTITACREAYVARYGPLPTRPRRVQADQVACLKCDAWWASPDPRYWRLCPTCRALAVDEDGAWLNGEAVQERGWQVADLLTITPGEMG